MKDFVKKYFKDLYNVDTQEEVGVHMCEYDRAQRRNYFGGVPIKKIEVEKFKNGKAAGKDEVTEEMVKGGGDVVGF